MILHQTVNSTGNYKMDGRFYGKFDYIPHFHRNFELIYVFSGSCTVDAGTGQHLLTGGELLLIPPFAVHNFHISDGSRVWIGVFSGDFIAGFASDRLYCPFRCDADADAFLRRHLFLEEPGDRFRAQACLYLVCDECQKHARISGQTDPGLIERILDVIVRHMTENITMAQTARELNYEYHYFSRLFHQVMAMNFKDFVNLYRVEYACELLRGTDRSVAAIALECGFQSVRNFNRCFAGIMQTTPTRFRAAQP